MKGKSHYDPQFSTFLKLGARNVLSDSSSKLL